MKDKIFITGANGFIGSHITELFITNGFDVVCILRQDSNRKNIEHLKIKTFTGDITDLNALTEAMKSCTFVIHCAAHVKDWGIYDDFYKTNVVGTLNVIKACQANNIKNIIITGSISSYGEEDSKTVKNEDSPYNPHYPYFLDKVFHSPFNFYRDTKALATRTAIEYACKYNLNLTVLEPAWVYGEREFNTGFFEYLKTVKNGIKIMPGSKQNKFHVIYVKDLAKAYLAAFNHKLKGINRIIIGNKEADNMCKIFFSFCIKAGINPPYLVPKWIIYPIGFLLELVYKIFNVKTPPLLMRSRINMFYDNIEYGTSKSETMLNFKCDYSLENGIENTVNWYKLHNYIQETV
ncbi:MAG: NAD(P)-dependent oxidoreductase [Candidatus Aureabacteria bacterium]|nr:NAD(P)-dependent oxidoreductase [Candidatus Auribacterota bacterium]